MDRTCSESVDPSYTPWSSPEVLYLASSARICSCIITIRLNAKTNSDHRYVDFRCYETACQSDEVAHHCPLSYTPARRGRQRAGVNRRRYCRWTFEVVGPSPMPALFWPIFRIRKERLGSKWRASTDQKCFGDDTFDRAIVSCLGAGRYRFRRSTIRVADRPIIRLRYPITQYQVSR